MRWGSKAAHSSLSPAPSFHVSNRKQGHNVSQFEFVMSDKERSIRLWLTQPHSLFNCSHLTHWWPPSSCFSASSSCGTNSWKSYVMMIFEPWILLMTRTSRKHHYLPPPPGFIKCWESVSGLWHMLGKDTTNWPTSSAGKMDCNIFLVLNVTTF